MNKLTPGKRAQTLQMMAEGISLRAMTRLTGVSRTTLIKLLADAGKAFSAYQDRTLVNLSCKRVQVDEAWAFCYAKQKRMYRPQKPPLKALATSGHGLGSTRTQNWSPLGMSADGTAKPR